jgi:PIN domain nuclease of toxin-antitoxin system
MEVIADPNNIIYVSAASIWEISIKNSIGKLETPDDIEEQIRIHRFIPLSLTFAHATKVARLPKLHKDPFDHMLIAQAIVEDLILITRDKEIPKYPGIKVIES